MADPTEDSSALATARATIARRLAIADTDDMLTLHEQQGGGGLDRPLQGYNSRLVSAGRRLVIAKATLRRLGHDSVLFTHLSSDLLVSVGSAVTSVPSLTGDWQVRGAFHHGEQYEYRMWLTEHADGRVTGKGRFHDHPLAPTFVVTRGLVILSDNTDTGQPFEETAKPSTRQPVLHMRQESNEFINFCSLVLSRDRAQMLEGEWMQLDLTSDAEAWADYQAAPFTVLKPHPDLENFGMWGWWGARRSHSNPPVLSGHCPSVDLFEHLSKPEPAVRVTAGVNGSTAMEPDSKLPCAPPEPGVIGTPRQWAAGIPLRRPPTCISDPVVEKGQWPDPDPDPTAEAGVRQQHDERADPQAWTRRRTLDGWR